MQQALADVLSERLRQDKKWGEQNHDPFLYLTVLMEEVGEVAKAALEFRFAPDDQTYDQAVAQVAHLREEAVQVAAVGLAIVECLDRDKWRWPVMPQ